MKKHFLLMAAVWSTTVVLAAATDYSLVGDWAYRTGSNPNGAWSYGTRIETGGLGTGVFEPFAAATLRDTINADWDRWIVDNTTETCNVWYVPGGLWNFPANSVILNAWTSYSSAVQWAGNPGTYNLSANFATGGYATPTEDYPDVRVFVTKNGSEILLATQLFGFTGVTAGNNGASLAQEITIAPGDYLDFFIAGNPEARATLNATLALVPEPSLVGLLGLGGLLLVLRRQR